jgi:lysophospholipid hydrolase
MGWDNATLMAKNAHASTYYHFDYTFPIVSLMAGGQITASMQEMFGTTRIEDLWLPCFCTSTDLTHNQLLVHTEGPVWKYARATTSLPGVFPPVVDDDRLLVDGGVLNNVPIDIMFAREDVGTVIVFDVGRRTTDQGEGYVYEAALSGWRVLWNRINPFAKKLEVPSFPNVMMRLVMLGNAQALRQAQNLARFYGVLDAGDAGMLDLDQFAAVVESGYRSGQALAAEWQAAFEELLPEDV